MLKGFSHNKLSSNKKATTGEIIGAVLILLLIGVLAGIFVPGINSQIKSFFGIINTVSNPQVNYTSTFLFTAQDLKINTDRVLVHERYKSRDNVIGSDKPSFDLVYELE